MVSALFKNIQQKAAGATRRHQIVADFLSDADKMLHNLQADLQGLGIEKDISVSYEISGHGYYGSCYPITIGDHTVYVANTKHMDSDELRISRFLGKPQHGYKDMCYTAQTHQEALDTIKDTVISCLTVDEKMKVANWSGDGENNARSPAPTPSV